MRPLFRMLTFFVLGLGVSIPSGCVETRVVRSSFDGLREIADPPRDPDDANTPAAARGTRYAIQLRSFTGADGLEQAFAFSTALRETGQIPGIWFIDRGEQVVVYAGRFRRPDNDDAKDSLKRARAARFENGRPFRRVEMVAIDPNREGVADRWDLRPHHGMRSLAVEIFDAGKTKNFRQRAETRAAELREETGLDVYYFLGHYQAYVGVGLFDPTVDYVMDSGVEMPGPRVRALQERFPRILRNGDPIQNPKAGTPDGTEPTVVIRVP